ncbi:toll/interleukin-1 receptor domain-containing protein [Sphingomonas solaris]|uniref:TIR domain-containing protein n=1 Tax=Alterirhizorhabdus solaris TaxID=2529389 RepID=A0A558RC75_9SPHN|nr:TIR domain-containing protein [Sphingomonas solaris]TVV76953.1 TIR domain-containing protein [Sphingomonas solaris]
MADIFLSYRRADRSIAVDELARIFERAGYSVWYAPKADVSDELASLMDEVRAARCVVGLWSRTAGQSPYVLEEFEAAHAARKLLAVETDEAKLPAQFLDRIAGRLTNVSAMTHGPELPQLLRGIVKIIGLPPRYKDVEDLIANTLDNDFGFYKIGNITIPARPILGIPKQPFAPRDVAITFDDVNHWDRETYPKILNKQFQHLFDTALSDHHLKAGGLTDNSLARLDSWDQAPEGQEDERGLVTFNFSKTSYFRIWATNSAIDVPFADENGRETTIRNSFCYQPYGDLSKSVLANNPGVEVVIISDTPQQTPQRQVLIRRRSEKAAGYKGWYQVSASGHLSLAHGDEEGRPSPFVTAIHEAKQEVADSLELDPDDYKMVGLLLKAQDLHPSFHGYIVTDRAADELKVEFCRDDWEGLKSAIAFDPDTVFTHIAENKWYPLSAMAMIAALQAFYPPSEVREAALRVKVKRAQDFYLVHNAGTDPN